MITTEQVLADLVADVLAERRAQDEKWGEQNHPDFYDGDEYRNPTSYARVADFWKRVNADRVVERNSKGTPADRNAAWDGVLLEEIYEGLAESEPVARRAELVQAVAVIVNWLECDARRAEGVAP